MIFVKYKSNVTKNKKIFKFVRVVSIFLLFLNFYFNNKISSFAKNINYIRECNKIEEYLKYCNNNLIKIKKSNKCCNYLD